MYCRIRCDHTFDAQLPYFRRQGFQLIGRPVWRELDEYRRALSTLSGQADSFVLQWTDDVA